MYGNHFGTFLPNKFLENAYIQDVEQNNHLFEEKQQFRQGWLWAFLFAVIVLPVPGVLIYQLVTGQQVGGNPAPDFVLVLLSLFVVLPVLLGFYFARLTTRVSREGIFFGWNFPTATLNKINWSEIKECKVIRYRFVGLGYRLATPYGTVYNVKGNKGLHVVKNDGTEFLIGTGKPEELRAIVAGHPVIPPGPGVVSGTAAAEGRTGF